MLQPLHITALALGLSVASLPAVALSPEQAPACWWDTATQAYADDGLPAWVAPAGNNFATTLMPDDAGFWTLLHHCPSANYLLVFAAERDFPAVDDRYRALIESETEYSMRQIGEQLAALGAQVRVGKGDTGRCDCAFLQSINALK